MWKQSLIDPQWKMQRSSFSRDVLTCIYSRYSKQSVDLAREQEHNQGLCTTAMADLLLSLVVTVNGVKHTLRRPASQSNKLHGIVLLLRPYTSGAACDKHASCRQVSTFVPYIFTQKTVVAQAHCCCPVAQLA